MSGMRKTPDKSLSLNSVCCSAILMQSSVRIQKSTSITTQEDFIRSTVVCLRKAPFVAAFSE